MSGARPVTERAAALLMAPLRFARGIPGLEVTELTPDEGAAQWRLATALQRAGAQPDFADTQPMQEAA